MRKSEVFSTTINDREVAALLDRYATERGMDRAKLVRYALQTCTGLDISGSIRPRKLANETFGLPDVTVAHIAANANLYPPEVLKARYGLTDRQIEAIRRQELVIG